MGNKSKQDIYLEKMTFHRRGALVFLMRKEFSNHSTSSDRRDLPGVTDQLEVGDSNGTLLIHIFLVFVLYQTFHQVPRVYLVIRHILGKMVHINTLFATSTEQILHPSLCKMKTRLILEPSQRRHIINYVKMSLRNSGE